MSASRRLLARLFPVVLPFAVACGGKTELPEPEPDDETAGRSGASSNRGGAGGSLGVGGRAGSTGVAGTSSGGGPIATGGSSPGIDLPACQVTGLCPRYCYPAKSGETCLPNTPREPLLQRFGCVIDVWGQGYEDGGQCCYSVGDCPGVGRPVIIAGATVVATLVHGMAWA